MILQIICITCFLAIGETAPLATQNFPLGFAYPGLNQIHQTMPQQYSMPIQLSSNQYNPGVNGPTFRQTTTFPGSLIGALPFLPIEINVAEIINSILQIFKGVLGSNSPFFQTGTMPAPSDILVNQDSMTPIGMMQKNSPYGQTIPIPIIVLVPYKQQLEENFSEKKL